MRSPRDIALPQLRSMTPAEKLRVADGLWRDARALTEAAVVQRHPDWTRERVLAETRRIMSGDRA
ncbi:MAG: hypothetical protein H7066_20290 [Cytophagaceae bacterium]|nr:hypothetical protein [Gemmatimonadaceae bacterium]